MVSTLLFVYIGASLLSLEARAYNNVAFRPSTLGKANPITSAVTRKALVRVQPVVLSKSAADLPSTARSTSTLAKFRPTCLEAATIADVDASNSEPDKVKDLLSGLVIAVANVPYSMAFAALAGLNPIAGLWNSVIVGLVAAIYGGRPGLMAGSASAVSVPLAVVNKNFGTNYLHASVMLSSLAIGSMSVFKLGRLISYVTDPAVYGFLNGLGFVMAKSQLKYFKGLSGLPFYSTCGVALGTALGTYFFPKLTTAVPSSLIALVLASVIAIAFKLPVKTIADVSGKISGGLAGLPKFQGFLPSVPLSLETLKIAAPAAVSVAVIVYLQSLLAAKVVANAPKICKSPETDNDRVLMGLALGNVLGSSFGGTGGCGLLPFTALNVSNGGRGTLSNLSAAGILGLLVLVAAPLLGRIPVSALSGVMAIVALKTVKWEPTLKLAKLAVAQNASASNRVDILTTLIGSYVCYRYDMAAGLVLGIVIQLMWKSFGEKK
jgi:SulP family sulfate permease